MSGPVALVTGSSRGVGLAAAPALGRAGFSVAVVGPAQDEEPASARASGALPRTTGQAISPFTT